MIVGIPAEVKDRESRVSMTPGGVAELVAHGHRVLVESGAGEGSGFSDEAYARAGAEVNPLTCRGVRPGRYDRQGEGAGAG